MTTSKPQWWQERLRALRWDQYKDKVFYDEGGEEDGESFLPGEFKVKEVITTDNSFICTRVFGENDDVVFDIGYVIRRIRVYEEEWSYSRNICDIDFVN